MWPHILDTVDCASFFARGQLGVAIGRVKTKAGLRGRNLNRYAANLKHSPCVYQFYDLHEMTAFTFPELVRRIFRQLASAFQDQPVAWFYVEKRRHWRITVLPS
jgi:hypothetical protein